MAVNPEAVAWYLKRSEALLGEHHRCSSSLRAGAIESMTRLGDRATRAVETAQRYFFGGLFLIGAAFGTVVVAVAF